MSTASSATAMIGTGVSTLLALAVELAILIIALTVVRRKNESAGAMIAASAAVSLFTSIASPIAYAVIGPLSSSGGIDGYMRISTLITVVMALIRTGGAVLLIFGLLRLSEQQPPGSPYR